MGFKWYKSKLVQSVNHFSMEVLGKQHISPKQYLIMVRIEGQKLLMGVTDQSINLVKEFSDGKQSKGQSDSNIISDS
jgi:flagellar biogenesis protein FliO